VIKTNGHIPFQTTVFEFTDDKPDFVIELQNQDIPKINEVVREKSKKEIAKEEAEKAKADAEKAKADEAAKAEAEKAKAEAEKAKAEATKTDADPKESK
jgi:aspartyl-tRNA synthetase